MSPSSRSRNKRSNKSLQEHASAAVPSVVPSESKTVPSADAELEQIVAAWPTLPEAIKAGILAMIKVAESR